MLKNIVLIKIFKKNTLFIFLEDYQKSKRKFKGIICFVIAFIGKILNYINNIQHFFSQNSLNGSRKNIKEHYDLGNDLFALFLDDSMTYSCAIFNGIFILLCI